jgi:hypothetical protein
VSVKKGNEIEKKSGELRNSLNQLIERFDMLGIKESELLDIKDGSNLIKKRFQIMLSELKYSLMGNKEYSFVYNEDIDRCFWTNDRCFWTI